MLITGRNGVGKTNLLESIHVGVQGFSPRTRKERQAIRFGHSAARVALRGVNQDVPVETRVTLRRDEPKEAWLNGSRLSSSEGLRAKLAALAFTPDRLVVAKGAPIVRRAYLDRAVSRLLPECSHIPAAYTQALSQRNAALRQVRDGLSTRDTVAPWNSQIITLGEELDAARGKVVEQISPAFVALGETFGLGKPRLRYEADPLTTEMLEERLETDIRRGTTGAGPHLRDLAVSVDGIDLRAYGSQGEQRLTVLALILAEANELTRSRTEPPLLLLDDVFSELDEGRMQTLVKWLPQNGQTLVTATSKPAEVNVDQHLSARPGEIREA